MATTIEIASISRESVEIFDELIEISNDELSTMQKLVQESKNLVENTNVVNKLLFEWNHGVERKGA